MDGSAPVARLKRVLSPRAQASAQAAAEHEHAAPTMMIMQHVDNRVAAQNGTVHGSGACADHVVKGGPAHPLAAPLSCLASCAAAGATIRDDMFASDAPPSASPASAWKRRAMLHPRPAPAGGSDAVVAEPQVSIYPSGACFLSRPDAEIAARRVASFSRQRQRLPVQVAESYVSEHPPTELELASAHLESDRVCMMEVSAPMALTNLRELAVEQAPSDCAAPMDVITESSELSLDSLPEDALINVLRHLPHIRDVLRARAVCHLWRNLIDSNVVIFSDASFKGVKFHRRVKLVLEPSLGLLKHSYEDSNIEHSLQNEARHHHHSARIILEEPAGRPVVQLARRGGNPVAELLYSVIFERCRVSVVSLPQHAALSLLEPRRAVVTASGLSVTCPPRGLRRLHCGWFVPHFSWIAIHVSRSELARRNTHAATGSFMTENEASSRGSILGLVLVTSCIDRFAGREGSDERLRAQRWSPPNMSERADIDDTVRNGEQLLERSISAQGLNATMTTVGTEPRSTESSTRFEWRVGAALRFDKALICAGHRGLRKLNNEMSEMIVQMPSELEWYA